MEGLQLGREKQRSKVKPRRRLDSKNLDFHYFLSVNSSFDRVDMAIFSHFTSPKLLSSRTMKIIILPPEHSAFSHSVDPPLSDVHF